MADFSSTTIFEPLGHALVDDAIPKEPPELLCLVREEEES